MTIKLVIFDLWQTLVYFDQRKIEVFPHVLPMLKALRRQKILIGLLSNSSVYQIKELEKQTDLLQFFDFPLFAFNVGLIKPDLRFFQKMLEVAHCQPKQAIMVGDSEENDIAPAKSIGINTIRYQNPKRLKEKFLEFQIPIV